MKMIIPAILSDSLDAIQAQIDQVATVPALGQVQVDIIDPEFADNITIAPIDLLQIDTRGLAIDLHLMTNDPINDVVEASQIPGIKTIIGQIEHMHSQQDFIQHVKSISIAAGLSLDLYTEPDELDQTLLDQLAVVQVMGNKAGEQGKTFAGQPILAKIEALAEIKQELALPFEIAVDIGMNPETIAQCARAGATQFVVGSFLWNAPDFALAVEALKKSL